MSTASPIDPPEHVGELALACVQFVQQKLRLELDFDPLTLPLLDHYLSTVESEQQAIHDLVAPVAGAYFGELVRQQFPARWYAPGEDYAVWRIEFEQCFLYFNPVAFAHEAIARRELVQGGTGFNVNARDVEALRAALDVLGTTNEEDYFRLTTRFEVLSTVVDRLLANIAARGESAVSLGPDVYRNAFREERLDVS